MWVLVFEFKLLGLQGKCLYLLRHVCGLLYHLFIYLYICSCFIQSLREPWLALTPYVVEDEPELLIMQSSLS